MNSRKIYIDLIRIIAIIGVIIIHITANNWYVTTIDYNWLTYNFINALFHPWAVPLFLTISGYLLLNKQIDNKQLLLKYIPRVLICLVFWHYFYYYYTYKSFNFITATKNLIIGKTYSHLWFLYMIIGIYIIYPIISKLVKRLSNKELIYLLAIIAIPSIILPNIEMLTNIDLLPYIKHFLIIYYSEYLFWFILGYYLSRISIKNNYINLLLSITSLILLIMTAWYSNYYSIINNKPTTFATTNTMLSILCVVSIFLIVPKNKDNKKNKLLIKLSNLTFGIYLIHFFVLKEIVKIPLIASICNPIISTLCNTIIVYLCSLIISWLISKVPVIKRLIGII